MKNFPIVTVVVPCLNRAEFLRPTIESILSQDYASIECIVIDGGSSDGTIEILQSYGDRIRWVSEPDTGHANAINKGWRMGRGELLAWLNADDIWEKPGAAGIAVDYLRKHPEVGVVYGDCGVIDANGHKVGPCYLREWDLEYAVLNCDHCIPQPAAFVRRTVVEGVGWLNEEFYQKKDHELWLRIALVSKIVHIPRLLAHERNVRGLSFDAKTAAPACAQVTREFFTQRDVPSSLRVRRRRALSNSYLMGAEYALSGGPLWGTILSYTIYAGLIDPTNARRVVGRMINFLRIRVRIWRSHRPWAQRSAPSSHRK